MKHSTFLLTSSLCAPFILLALLAFSVVRNARATPSATFVVNSVADSGPAVDCDDGSCELREAMEAAALSPGPDTIVFALPDHSTITLSLGALPAIGEDLTIDGSAPAGLAVSGNHTSGIFEIVGNATVTMTSVILQDAVAEDGSAVYVQDGTLTLLDSSVVGNSASYGAIRIDNQSQVSLQRVQLTSNTATIEGGGVYNSTGFLTVDDSTFHSNDAQEGGGIFNAGGFVTISDSSFTANSAALGGAITNWQTGVMTVTQSTFTANQAGSGAAINSSGALTIYGSEFHNNQAGQGGAIDAWLASIDIDSSTFTANSASGQGGAIYASQSDVVIMTTGLYSNTANFGGGAVQSQSGHLWLNDSVVSSNSAGHNGGAIDMSGYLTVTQSIISDNSAAEYGGGVYANGVLTLVTNTISENSAGINGGGVYNFDGSVVLIATSIFHANTALDEGGGVYNAHGGTAEVTVTESTFSANSAGSGGGIVNNAQLAVNLSTFTANSAGGAGAIVNYETLDVSNNTFSGNSATFNGGAIIDSGFAITLTNNTFSENTAGAAGGAFYSTSGSTLFFANNILANSPAGLDCWISNGTVVDGGGNLMETGNCPLPIAGDPHLGPLADNDGSWTQTHALLAGSPAIDAGNDALCPAVDQRRFFRPRDGDGDGEARCDSGSYELTEPYADPYLASLSLESPIDEGESTRLTGIADSTTPGAQLELTVNWGDGTDVTIPGTAPMDIDLTHTYADDGIYTVQVSIAGDAGISDSRQISIDVFNVVPLVNAGPDRTVALGDAMLVAATFVDPGADSHTATVDWGDGNLEAASVAGNQVTASHIYDQIGQYTVTVTVEDDGLASGSATFMATVSQETQDTYRLYLPVVRRD